MYMTCIFVEQYAHSVDEADRNPGIELKTVRNRDGTSSIAGWKFEMAHRCISQTNTVQDAHTFHVLPANPLYSSYSW